MGNLTEETQEIWILFHGYGQLANNFIESFLPLLRNDRFLVAPEGLSRFYQRRGKEPQSVGASWMTREERLTEISDYLWMIEQVMDRIRVIPNSENCRLVGLGFSQGTATLTRWALWSKYQLYAMVLYAGDFAYETDLKELQEKLQRAHCYLIAGEEDPFISPQRFEKIRKKVETSGLPYDEIRYPGNHEVSPQALGILSELTDYYHTLSD